VRLVREGRRRYKPARISSAGDVYGFMLGLKDRDRERFYTLHLDRQNNILKCEEVACGSISSVTVYPREVFNSAILSSSKSIILVHNHPSGDPSPSTDDAQMTKKLCKCEELMGIDVLYSVIIGDESYYSFKESGRLNEYRLERQKPRHKSELRETSPISGHCKNLEIVLITRRSAVRIHPRLLIISGMTTRFFHDALVALRNHADG
jgi:DNA repair protein RadC